MEHDERTERPGLQVVAENTPAALVENEAVERLTWALRELTANLLRIVRGAGKPHDIVTHLDAVVETIARYRDIVGRWPLPDQISEALSIERDEEWQQRLMGPRLDRFYAEQQIIRGVLQHVAGRLLGQTTHQSVGENELYDGIRALEEARKELRNERETASKPTQSSSRGRARQS